VTGHGPVAPTGTGIGIGIGIGTDTGRDGPDAGPGCLTA
jgi:hypothetical protein